MDRQLLESLVDTIAVSEKVDPLLLRAIVQVESSWNPKAIRFEPHYRYTYFPNNYDWRLGISNDTETALQKFSWGLPQVMGAVMREYGFSRNLIECLDDPGIALQYGAKHLRRLHEKHGYEPDVVSSYNQGSPRKQKSGAMYENQQYVDKVYAVLREMRKIRLQ
jgi:soluble lytic murein transglycosylase-like protein